jgi:hypothetical protein
MAGRAMRPWDRRATGSVALMALLLLAVSLGGFFYLRRELAEIAAEHLRLRVSGPAKLQPAVANQFRIFTSSVTGGRLPAQVQLSLYASDTKRLLLGYNERTDSDGRLLVTIPAEKLPATAADLQIVAAQGNRVERVATRLAVAPVGYVTQLAADRPSYRPGDTVYFRWRALTCFALEADRPLKVRFEVQGPDGVPLAGSGSDRVSQQGVAAGAFAFPTDLPDGNYTLVAHSPEAFLCDRRCSLSVRGGRDLRPATGSSTSGDPASPEVRFYPEGGELVAGLANRVYVLASDPQGEPLHIRGKVVDVQGEARATAETAYQGMGQFSFQPQAGETYRLEIESPARRIVKLPEVATGGKVVLSTGIGVFEAGKPLEFNVRATTDGLPLVAAAYCRGLLVGQQPFTSHVGANEVSVNADGADGVIRLVIYDYSVSPPEPVAQRLVLRRPSRRLRVRLADRRERYARGGHVSLSLLVTDENDKPMPAVLGVSVVDTALLGPSPSRRPRTPTDPLLAADFDKPEDVAALDEFLSQQPKSAATVDLLLGTRGAGAAQRTPHAPREDLRHAERDEHLAESDPPAMFDNLADLEKRYRKSLDAYQAKRTQLLSTLTIMSFFGAGGLVLLAAMLSLLRIASGLRIWLPALLSAAISLYVGTIVLNPESLKSGMKPGAAYVPFHLAPDRSVPLSLRERVGVREPDLTPSSPARSGVAEEYRHLHKPGQRDDAPQTVYWNPRLIVPPDGRAKIEFDLSDAATTFRIRIDAHAAGGRVAAAEDELKSGS